MEAESENVSNKVCDIPYVPISANEIGPTREVSSVPHGDGGRGNKSNEAPLGMECSQSGICAHREWFRQYSHFIEEDTINTPDRYQELIACLTEEEIAKLDDTNTVNETHFFELTKLYGQHEFLNEIVYMDAVKRGDILSSKHRGEWIGVVDGKIWKSENNKMYFSSKYEILQDPKFSSLCDTYKKCFLAQVGNAFPKGFVGGIQ